MSQRRRLANAIRALSMDAVQQAASGHPGAPMGMADIAEVLWREVMDFNPANPRWPDRDRFVLSNGHASMLLYSANHLSGYPLSIDDLRAFRQIGSRTPGHPENDLDIGIETTTGPLGQGLATAVGMALAERLLAAEFNRPGHDIVDHHTYVFLGDGCLMEGISHEAVSLAGTLGLGKLICVYDDNGISIDGAVSGWMADDTPKRFAACGWQVIKDVDGHDGDAVLKALRRAKANRRQPALICARTVIGFGAPNKQGSKSTHGEPLGVEEVAAARAAPIGTNAPAASAPSAPGSAVSTATVASSPISLRSSPAVWRANCPSTGRAFVMSRSPLPSPSRHRRRRALPRRSCSTRSGRGWANCSVVRRTSPGQSTPSARIPSP
jgi:transketolase